MPWRLCVSSTRSSVFYHPCYRSELIDRNAADRIVLNPGGFGPSNLRTSQSHPGASPGSSPASPISDTGRPSLREGHDDSLSHPSRDPSTDRIRARTRKTVGVFYAKSGSGHD